MKLTLVLTTGKREWRGWGHLMHPFKHTHFLQGVATFNMPFIQQSLSTIVLHIHKVACELVYRGFMAVHSPILFPGALQKHHNFHCATHTNMVAWRISHKHGAHCCHRRKRAWEVLKWVGRWWTLCASTSLLRWVGSILVLPTIHSTSTLV